MFNHYRALNALRNPNGVLVNGDFKMLLADDATGIVAYGRKTNSQAAVIIVNRSDSGITIHHCSFGRNYEFAVGVGFSRKITIIIAISLTIMPVECMHMRL